MVSRQVGRSFYVIGDASYAAKPKLNMAQAWLYVFRYGNTVLSSDVVAVSSMVVGRATRLRQSNQY